MDSHSRLTATRYIWTAFFFGLAVVNSNLFQGGEIGVGNIITTIMVVGAAIVGTGFIWNWGDLPTIQSQSAEAEAENKLKRGERVQRLVELMDEDELYELRRRLEIDYSDSPKRIILGDDGELLQESRLE